MYTFQMSNRLGSLEMRPSNMVRPSSGDAQCLNSNRANFMMVATCLRLGRMVRALRREEEEEEEGKEEEQEEQEEGET